ncbi:hypothetical protein [Tenacibaculum maritimum]|uniref:hypothetical protein n=1 Tax=Tenacibaculum maritimum TaxID=107401 RepID=UPI001E3C7E64|nr:hypothetical protein [Tenacibaculum maritimum]MCD9564274.1 hypothetical protein [Tenacibaculum maritimum]MCD9567057.1 hypothetical protein [Tenacibaculum maritimum]MCD9578807.1 hypothetical protein [Tenacibaculum maritimum]MCD9598028.1 hypothetical protein [Tenacibaculum maritimum]MCD9614927.1 hypothetical protein [Tenacibaculum maritimum]
MTENIKKINNPLTIIAIFAALAEVNATIAIGLINENLHYIFIWFVILFPTILVILFFITLNFNTKVMYSPSDYKDDKNFMDSLFRNKNYYSNDKVSTLKLDNIEKNLSDLIDEKFKKISKQNDNNPQLLETINTIKEQLKKETDKTLESAISPAIVSSDLKAKLLNYFELPAFYLLINAIVRTNAKKPEKLAEFQEKYSLPYGWEEGLVRLINDSILIGTNENFKINEKFSSDLKNWTGKNGLRLKILQKAFKDQSESENQNEEKKHDIRIKNYTSRLKF